MKSNLLVAVLAVALVGPSALPAFATKNTGSHIDSAEFNKGGAQCQNSFVLFDDMMSRMKEAKTKEARAAARDAANSAINQGYAAGCAWVAAV